MRILFASLEHDRYDPRRGKSFEYNNFTLALKASDHEIFYSPFDRILEVGKRQFNRELVSHVAEWKPDVFFAFMYTDELEPEALEEIRTMVPTVAWFSDDYWRFFNYSKRWAGHFDWLVTTYSKAVEWYRRAGFTNVIRSQWGVSPAVYHPIDAPQDIEVSFIGQYKPPRGRLLRMLSQAGVKVEAFGSGWPNGRCSHEEMLRIVGRSKVNLNLNVRPGWSDPRVIARIFLRRSVTRIVPDFSLLDNVQAYLHFPTLHTHARPFELAACRAFVISGRSEDITECYEEGREMVFYDSPEDLFRKIRYYLSRETERKGIARAGYERTLREHTYGRRFEEIFNRMDLLPRKKP